jgi:Co/Zn/Cd efflux system component
MVPVSLQRATLNLIRGDQMNCDKCGTDEFANNLAHTDWSYKRALRLVVLLNVGYGTVELVAGFIAASQALKADALDFIGDGLITFLGVLALGWRPGWRAKSALLQGVFLGALGLAVLGGTVYRVFVLKVPQPTIMGLFGAVALAVNITAALVLLSHRKGDANVRAVWLFSRNDAIGNLIVVVAAGLVAWTGRSWPDVVAAAVIASVFLRSACSIVKDAYEELRHKS